MQFPPGRDAPPLAHLSIVTGRFGIVNSSTNQAELRVRAQGSADLLPKVCGFSATERKPAFQALRLFCNRVVAHT
jgi:hypothetical protein